MLYRTKINVDWYHRPTETWGHTSEHRDIRAVSRKHALNKGDDIVLNSEALTVIRNDPDMDFSWEIKLLD